MTATATAEAPATKKTTRYLLLEGQHIEPTVDGKSHVKILAGQDFESEQDWYAQRWPEKFRLMDERLLAPGSHVWNPHQESIEQFSERMKGSKLQAQNKGLTNQEAQSSIAELYESMTVEELKAHASQEMIDLRGAKTKADIIRVLMQHSV